MNVLFLCSGNSARSICAEVLLRDIGGKRFRSFSAGTSPTGRIHSGTLAILGRNGHETSGLASKSVRTLVDGPPMDIVLTVCDRAAVADSIPHKGRPVASYWGVPDPVGRPDENEAFRETYATLRRRIEVFSDLPFDALEARDLQRQLDRIGTLSS
nr:arsenate reductase ArsC [Aliihoeflea sp. 40Bstr573]